MNRKWKESKKSLKQSPLLYEDEEVGTSSPDEVKVRKVSATPKSKLCSGHSTPIRKKNITDSSDSPELNYNDSPIEPLTQNPPNEVGWDYHRPITKDEEEEKSPLLLDISRTPKRNVLLSKKRNSNSPLLYKPLKKKLHELDKEGMAGFVEELKAIASKAKQNEDKNVEVSEDKESELVCEMDSQPSDDSDIKLQVSANTEESPGQKKITTTNKDYKALLDDSIEDMMILCSQEVEEKEFQNKKVLGANAANSLQDKSSSPDSSLSKIFKNLTNDGQMKKNNNIFDSNSPSKNSSTSKGDTNSLEIPDDSFDEFFREIDDKNLTKNINAEVSINTITKTVKTVSKNNSKTVLSSTVATNSISQNKFFQSKTSNCTAQPKVVPSKLTHNYVKCPETSNALVQNKVVNTKASYGYLNQDYAKHMSSSGYSSQSQSSHQNNISNSRIFKAKSFSDTVSTSAENKSWRRVLSTSSINRSSTCNKNQQSNNESQSSPEEIERKRREAILKREAKLKMLRNAPLRPLSTNQNLIKR